MIRGIHHVQLTVPHGAEEEARRFYRLVLGLPEIQKPAGLTGRGGLWLQVGDRQVHIGVEDGVNRSATKAHIAYEVSNLQEWNVLLPSGVSASRGRQGQGGRGRVDAVRASARTAPDPAARR